MERWGVERIIVEIYGRGLGAEISHETPIALYLMQKYAKIFVQGHNLF